MLCHEVKAALLGCILAACGGVEPGGIDEADTAALSPFTLQFTGLYAGPRELLLRRDGTSQAPDQLVRGVTFINIRRMLGLNLRVTGHG